MKYSEYLDAARRHGEACRVILDKIENNEHTPVDIKQQSLTLTLFYLSGYIIECSLKFKIFVAFNYSEEMDILEDECKKIGINYRKKIKVHDYNTLSELIESKISGFSHLHESDLELNNIIGKWAPEFRYVNANLNYLDVKNFYSHAMTILRKV